MILQIVRMRVNLAGKKQGKHTVCLKICLVKSNLASVTTKVWGESEYYLDLENEENDDFVISSHLLIRIQHRVTPC